ncbi:MAG: hypothetical protein M3132_11690 [Actinomycetia bacterium]|nr:hypothetical protein [Actinomycetes bacterium]
MTRHTKKRSGIRRLVELLAYIAGTTLVIFALSSVALLLYTNGVAEPAATTVDILPGTSSLVASGENPLDIPPVWSFNAEDTLTLLNNDVVAHNLGDTIVLPAQSATIEMGITTGGELLTSLHPLGVISVSVEPSRFDFSIIAFTTFAFGISVGVILFIGASIVRAMGHNDDDWDDDDWDDDWDDMTVSAGDLEHDVDPTQ